MCLKGLIISFLRRKIIEQKLQELKDKFSDNLEKQITYIYGIIKEPFCGKKEKNIHFTGNFSISQEIFPFHRIKFSNDRLNTGFYIKHFVVWFIGIAQHVWRCFYPKIKVYARTAFNVSSFSWTPFEHRQLIRVGK